MSIIPLRTAKVARLGVVAALVGAGVVGMTGNAYATTPGATVVPATGPTTAAVIALTGTGFQNAAGANVATRVGFSTAACTTTVPAAAMLGTQLNVVSATRLVVKTPTAGLALTASKATAYYVCVYDGSAATANILGQGTYTVFTAPTATSVAPVGGPTYGGQTITVVGTGFTAKTSGTIDGVALTNVKAAGDGLSFTATTPAGVAPASGSHNAIVVSTEYGKQSNSAVNYDYAKAIAISPATGVIAGGKSLTVKGSGFAAMDFVTAGAAAVVFSDGPFAPVSDGASSSPKVVNGGLATCGSVNVVSDTELVCITPDMHTAYANGVALNVSVVSGYNSTEEATGGAYTASVPATPARHSDPLPTDWISGVSSQSTYTFSAF